MLVYRTQTETVDPAAELARLRARTYSSHDDVTDLLIRLGQVESAVIDRLSPDADGYSVVAEALRRASLAAGHAFRSFMAGRDADLRAWIARLGATLDLVLSCGLPARVSLSVPEGYAYYALYPEMYVEAALRFFEAVRPERAVAVGIRSIGTSLSAVVGATLEDCGCAVESWTLRPRGHPFDRRVVLDPDFEKDLAQAADAHFVVVDEGPGLSGSSLTSTAAKLSESGIPDDRISFFPSWAPDGAAFRSTAARARWQRHAKYTVPFEEVHPAAGLIDISAGHWRERFLGSAPWPAVQPQHERRKYLGPGFTLRFAGLGRFGRAKLARACSLADYRFSPCPISLSGGFLKLEWVEGRPLSGRADVCRELLDAIARYLGFLARQPSGAAGASFEELVEMIEVNTGECDRNLPAEFRSVVNDARPVAIDGRMLAHEWLRTASGYVKTDSLDHHDDHFYPGHQDIAWDLAGAQAEFSLDDRETEYVADKSAAPGILRRLPFYAKAYSAFRLGYATLARDTLAGSSDAARFDALRTTLKSRSGSPPAGPRLHRAGP